MDLTDRRGGDRGKREIQHIILPVFTQCIAQHFSKLDFGHRTGIFPQTGKDCGQFFRKKISAVHGNKLPYFHGGTAHGGQFVGYAGDVGRRQQQVSHGRPLPFQ